MFGLLYSVSWFPFALYWNPTIKDDHFSTLQVWCLKWHITSALLKLYFCTKQQNRPKETPTAHSGKSLKFPWVSLLFPSIIQTSRKLLSQYKTTLLAGLTWRGIWSYFIENHILTFCSLPTVDDYIKYNYHTNITAYMQYMNICIEKNLAFLQPSTYDFFR
jgi:hypothetical protein